MKPLMLMALLAFSLLLLGCVSADDAPPSLAIMQASKNATVMKFGGNEEWCVPGARFPLPTNDEGLLVKGYEEKYGKRLCRLEGVLYAEQNISVSILTDIEASNGEMNIYRDGELTSFSAFRDGVEIEESGGEDHGHEGSGPSCPAGEQLIEEMLRNDSYVLAKNESDENYTTLTFVPRNQSAGQNGTVIIVKER